MPITACQLVWSMLLLFLPYSASFLGSIQSYYGLQQFQFCAGWTRPDNTALHALTGSMAANNGFLIIGDTSDDALFEILSNSLSTRKSPTASSVSDAIDAHIRGENALIDLISATAGADDLLDYLLSVNSVFFLKDQMLHDAASLETIRQACKYTVYMPSEGSLNYGHGSNKKNLVSSTAERFMRLIDRVSGQNGSGKKYSPPAAGTSDVIDVSENETVAYSRQQVLTDAGEWSHFLSLTFPTIDEALPLLPELRVGSDALELRVDLLQDYSPASLHRQIALLRDYMNQSLPIVFTVRTKGQIGQFEDDAIEQIMSLLIEGMKAASEWIDIEGSLPKSVIRAVAEVGKEHYSATSRLLGSLHITTPPKDSAEVEKMYQACDLFGYADVLKVVTGAASREDCELVHRIGGAQEKPYIGLCLGETGAYSRVINRRFTPVTHELMAAAAPGQLTVKQLMAEREKEGLVKKKHFFLFGTPIQQSLSPVMHNNAYRALNLPHIYELNEQSDVAAYESVLGDSTFGGASVTIPYKESIIPYLHAVHGAAEIIGAVNTIAIDDQSNDRRLVGYNTDWIGIQRPIKRQLIRQGRFHNLTKKRIGLVIGAGGTARAACYAVKDLGLRLMVANRSPEKARILADKFKGVAVSMDDIEDAIVPEYLQVVISTLPAAAEFKLPATLLQSKPVILDVVYKPAKTALITQAIENDCSFIQGATMLFEQGVEQFEIWNKRRAPRNEMEAAVFNGVEKL